jgi:acetyl esterase
MTANTAETFELDVEDIEYLRHGNKPLLARLFKPRGTGPFPLVVEVHGGAWCNGDRLNDAIINEPAGQERCDGGGVGFPHAARGRVPSFAGRPTSTMRSGGSRHGRWNWGVGPIWLELWEFRAAGTKPCCWQ